MNRHLHNNHNTFSSRFLLLILAGLLYFSAAYSQSGKVPPFRMAQPDGKVFRAQDLPLGKPIVIIYFSPDCEECQKLTKELLIRMDEFSGVSFAMITYQPVENVKQYVKKNNLDKFPNIFAGTEGSTLFVRNYYDIRLFPFMVLYTKNGDTVAKYNSTQINLDDLLYRINHL